MSIDTHTFSDNQIDADVTANAFSGNTAEANAIKVAGNTVNINLPQSGGTHQNALLRFVDGIKKLRDPVGYERERQEVTLIAIQTEERIVESYRRMFPGMDERRLFMLAHGYTMTDAQAKNVFDTMERSAEMTPNPAKELPSASFTDSFVEGSSRAYDDEVQQMFAQILAGELERPGMFSRRSMAILSDMEKEQVEAFRRLCTFLFEIATISSTYSVLALTLDDDGSAYNGGRISWSEVSELSALGLVEVGGSRSITVEPGQSVLLRLGDRDTALSHHCDSNKKISFDPMLTRAGDELSRLCKERDFEGMLFALQSRARANEFDVVVLA